MPHSSPSGLYPEAPAPGLTLTLPVATGSSTLHLTQHPRAGEGSRETPHLRGAGIVPSQTLRVQGVGDRHHNHQHITAVTILAPLAHGTALTPVPQLTLQNKGPKHP